ncbi:MAG: PspC domain-containing protein [Tetrasphaera sp.]
MTTTTSHSPYTTSTPSGLDRFFGKLHASPFTRSDNHVIGGVCGAVAERLGLAPKVVRIAAVVLAFFGPVATVYLVAWLLLPDRRGRVHVEQALRGGEGKSIALLVLTGLVLFSDGFAHINFGWVALAAVAVAVVFLVSGRRGAAGGHHSTGTPAAPTTPPAAYPQDAPRW